MNAFNSAILRDETHTFIHCISLVTTILIIRGSFFFYIKAISIFYNNMIISFFSLVFFHYNSTSQCTATSQYFQSVHTYMYKDRFKACVRICQFHIFQSTQWRTKKKLFGQNMATVHIGHQWFVNVLRLFYFIKNIFILSNISFPYKGYRKSSRGLNQKTEKAHICTFLRD